MTKIVISGVFLVFLTACSQHETGIFETDNALTEEKSAITLLEEVKNSVKEEINSKGSTCKYVGSSYQEYSMFKEVLDSKASDIKSHTVQPVSNILVLYEKEGWGDLNFSRVNDYKDFMTSRKDENWHEIEFKNINGFELWLGITEKNGQCTSFVMGGTIWD